MSMCFVPSWFKGHTLNNCILHEPHFIGLVQITNLIDRVLMLTLPEMLMILHSWDAFHIILKLPFRQKHNFTLVQTNHASIALKERGGYKTYIIQKPNHIFLLCQHPQQEHQPHSTMEDTDSITTQINRFNKYSKIDGGCRRGTNLNRRHHVHVY